MVWVFKLTFLLFFLFGMRNEELLTSYSTAELQEMAAAGQEVLKWEKCVAQMDHYPLEDVFDEKSRAQYYYHAHRRGEQGHFHLFLREEEDDYAHLVAISMDKKGRAQGLFTTNRWVTDEKNYPPAVRKEMVRHFHVGHDHPSHAINQWLNAMVVLFRPQIDRLIEKRDKRRFLPIEITSETKISVKAQLKKIQKILEERELSSKF